MVTTGMQLTFNVLATAANGAADGLLALALESDETTVRQQAITAILNRRTDRGALLILKMWEDLNDSELRAVQEHPAAMQAVIAGVLKGQADAPLWLTALSALRMLSLDGLLPLVIDRLETAGDRRLRQHMMAAVMDVSGSLGTSAREGRGRPSLREPVVRRLAESIRRMNFHRCEGLSEAFLAASSWGDRELRILLTEDLEAARRLETPLMTSTVPGVLQLIAGYLRRKHIPAGVRQAIELRSDELFRNALLKTVGGEPTTMLLRHLREMPLLAIFHSLETLANETPSTFLVGLVHAHTANNDSPVDKLTLLLDVIAKGNHDAEAAVAIALAHCPPLDPEILLQAAAALASDSGQMQPHLVPYQRVIKRVLKLLDHPSQAIVHGLQHVMQGLHAEHFVKVIDELPAVQLPAVGGVICRIDRNAANTLAQALRSPLIERRRQAVKAIVACGLVNSLESALTQIAKDDYREVRILALQALVQGQDEASLVALEGAAFGPDGSQRDAAIDSLTERLEELKSTPNAGPNTGQNTGSPGQSSFTLPANSLQLDASQNRLQS
ncbi:HEAT repeat domain-containing protein [Planctomycetaceae bacterium SH139]